jgi:RHS repeat-associated protein
MSQSESTTYDAYGREATHVDFKGQTEVFHYDSLGRNDTKTFYPTGSQTPGETVTYHFDTLGRNDTITDVIGTNTRLTSYGFDLDNRVTSITTPEGTINYAYDPATGFRTRTYTTNSDITYAPDQLQRLKTVTVTKQNGVTLGTSLVTTYYYTPVGNIDHVTYPNGTETDYAYDTLNRLTTVTNKKGSTVLSSYVYTLEADGLRTGVTEHQLESDNSTSTVTKIWTYDALQRLTQEAVTSSISANSYTDSYTMDLVGNRLTKTHAQGGQTLTSSYTYNANDQLTTETGSGSSTYSTTYGYDTNGSLTTVTRTGAGAETDSYGYDLQNRMNAANISRTENGQAVTIAASYSYNDDGIRAQTVQTTTIGNGSPSTTTTQYLIDPDNPSDYEQVLEEHTNGSSTPNMSYLIGLSILGQTNGSGATNILLPDGQGSTRLLTDIVGAILARYAYDAYGNVLGTTLGVANPPLTSILFSNQQFDSSLQEVYLRGRYLRPTSGEFTQFDDVTGHLNQPLTLNKYIYCTSDPINQVDPGGHDPIGDLVVNIAVRMQAFVKWVTPIAYTTWIVAGIVFASATVVAIIQQAIWGSVDPFTEDVMQFSGLVFLSIPFAMELLYDTNDALTALASLSRPSRIGSQAGAAVLQKRAEQLNSMRSGRDPEMGTTSAIKAINFHTKETRTFITINGTKGMPKAWEGKLGPDEEFLRGPGHAEQTFFNLKGPDWCVIEGGTSRNVCKEFCKPLLDFTRLRLGGKEFDGKPHNTKFRMFWREQ